MEARDPANDPKASLLVIDDDQELCAMLVEYLGPEGFATASVATGPAGLAHLARTPVDLVVLDVSLPELSGFEVLRRVRAVSRVPVIMLTARGEEVDRVVGLELGADDYVVKPFSARELAARIRAILRRGRGETRREVIEVGPVRLDAASRMVTKDGQPVELAAREFDLLQLLMRRAGEVVRREEIMDLVWDEHWFGSTKTLDVHVSWLRKKLEDDPARPVLITTIRGVGFRFAGPEDLRPAR